LHSFVKFILILEQILVSDVNISITILIALARLSTCASNSFLKLSKTSLINVSASFLIISSFRIFCKVIAFVLSHFLFSIDFAIIVCKSNIVRIR